MKRFVVIKGLRNQPKGFHIVADLYTLSVSYKTSGEIKKAIENLGAEYDNIVIDNSGRMIIQNKYYTVYGDHAILAKYYNMILIVNTHRVEIIDHSVFAMLYDADSIDAEDATGINREADLFNSKMRMLGNNSMMAFPIDSDHAILHISGYNKPDKIKIPKCITALENGFFNFKETEVSGGENVECISGGSRTNFVPNIKVETLTKLRFIGDYGLENYPHKDLCLNNLFYIGIEAFNNSSIENLTITGTIPYIADGAFKSCKNLKTVKIMPGLVKITSECFKGCRSLEYIEVPYGCKEIESFAFMECYSLKEIKLNDDLDRIHGASCFRNCPKLETLCLPKSLRMISDTDFSFLSNLKKIIVPKELIRTHKFSIPTDCELITY